MRERSAVLLWISLFAVVVLIAGLLGRSAGGPAQTDERASTFVTSPGGASALYEALPALGVKVSRWRERPALLDTSSRSGRSLAVLAPSRLTPETERALFDLSRRGTLILAANPFSSGTEDVIDCLGYRVTQLVFDSAVTAIESSVPGRAFYAHGTFALKAQDATVSRRQLLARPPCHRPGIARVDTLLTSARGPVLIRLARDSANGSILLAADVGLFRNEAIRETRAGPFMLSLIAARTTAVTFDEYDQGFGPGGSLGGAIIAWSVASPVGWGIWQAAIVGLLALLALGVRFGPPIRIDEHRRRASREHVHALATALAAAHGHDVAIATLVRGLKRRLTPLGRGTREDEHVWLESLAPRAMTRTARESIERLTKLSTPGQNEAAVLSAAQAVEDVWDTLRQPTLRTSPR